MQLFLSWSGERSKAVASALREWLPLVLNSLDVWMSSEDIVSGKRWGSAIEGRLKTSSAGIICLTPENVASEWILFEAGALSNAVENSLVCPYLLDLEPTDLSGPLAQFQARTADKEGTRRLLENLNQALGVRFVEQNQLSTAFKHLWPPLDRKLSDALSQRIGSGPPSRSDRDLIQEILTGIRRLNRHTRLLAKAPTVTMDVPLSRDLYEWAAGAAKYRDCPVNDVLTELVDDFVHDVVDHPETWPALKRKFMERESAPANMQPESDEVPNDQLSQSINPEGSVGI